MRYLQYVCVKFNLQLYWRMEVGLYKALYSLDCYLYITLIFPERGEVFALGRVNLRWGDRDL